MPLLSRHVPPLLRQVANKPHATEEDHERDPESSGDELAIDEISTPHCPTGTLSKATRPRRGAGGKVETAVLPSKDALNSEKSEEDMFGETVMFKGTKPS